MVTSRDVAEKMKELTDKINKSESARGEIAKWISTYDGKIIQWHLGESSEDKFYVVFSNEGAKFGEGDYPSPDMVWICEPQVWLDFQSGAIDMRKALEESKVFMWGSLHEAMPFMMIIMMALSEGT
nr:SCP2 sterol-binding domain-containing protein [Candidatus Njordarchaeota archaeon]